VITNKKSTKMAKAAKTPKDCTSTSGEVAVAMKAAMVVKDVTNIALVARL
jgi:hypothetical protein